MRLEPWAGKLARGFYFEMIAKLRLLILMKLQLDSESQCV